MHDRKSALLGLTVGVGLVTFAGLLMGQGASQPVKSAPQFFVTADGEGAHLWVREGSALRVVGHGVCKECTAASHSHGHNDGEGHDHGKDASKK